MRKLIWMVTLLGLGMLAGAASAQNAAFTGYCQLGAKQANVSGLNSTNYLNGVIPKCTVKVYLTGTLTTATIYSNSTGTPLGNPFLANATSGQWLFYASNSAAYDVVLSGGVAPNTYPAPVTLTGLSNGIGGGSGNFVTIDTAQSVTGVKTIANGMIFSNPDSSPGALYLGNIEPGAPKNDSSQISSEFGILGFNSYGVGTGVFGEFSWNSLDGDGNSGQNIMLLTPGLLKLGTATVCTSANAGSTFGCGGGGITSLTGPVTASGPGAAAATITPTGVTAGTYVFGGGNAVTFNAAGQAIFAGTAFQITSFTCSVCGTRETGNSVTNPSGTAAYSNPTVPTSASVSDGTNVTTLTTPFTSWASAHTYSSNTTFTLTAIGNGQTTSATQSLTFAPRSFGGVGTGAGATGATASGNTAVLVGSTGTLVAPTGGSALASSSVGQSYNVTTIATQYIYLLLVTNVANPGTGSFTTPGPAVFPMNAPTSVTFINQFGSSVPGFLYQSTNAYPTGTTFNITVGI